MKKVKTAKACARKFLAIGLVLAFMCLTTACTNGTASNNGSDSMAENNQSNSGNTANNGSTIGNGSGSTASNRSNGTASNNNNTNNGSNNNSYSNGSYNNGSYNNSVTEGTDNGRSSLLGDAGDAITGAIDDVANGVSDLAGSARNSINNYSAGTNGSGVNGGTAGGSMR